MPEQRFEADWPFPQRLPLGAGWSGTCTAVDGGGVRPSDEELKSACNIGYARTCTRLPAQREADAVRFALGEEREGLLRVRFALERDYLPASHGELLYEIATRRWHGAHSSEGLLRMAECFVQSQLSRRGMDAARQTTSPGVLKETHGA